MPIIAAFASTLAHKSLNLLVLLLSGNPSFIQLTGVEYYNALLKEQLAQFYDDLCGYSSIVWRHFMSHHDNELDKKELINGADDASDNLARSVAVY